MPDANDLLGTRLTLAQACRPLRVDPPLRPGETVSWMQRHPETGTGINAALYCHDPARDDEPYALSLGAYEEARIKGPNGEDYGTDRSVIARLDFALDVPEGEDPQPLDDPPKTRIKLVAAALGAGLGADDDQPLAAVLSEVGRILAGWPAVRESGEATEPADGTD